MRLWAALLLALLLAAPAGAQEGPVLGRNRLTLEEALAWAKGHHPLLKASDARIVQAQARLKQSLASNVPQISVGVARSHENLQDGGMPPASPTVLDLGPLLPPLVIPGQQPNEVTVILNPRVDFSYQLFDGGRRNRLVEKSEQDLLTYDYDWQTQWRTLSFNIRQQYLTVVLNQRLLLVQEENVRMAEDSVQQARGLVRGGRKSQLDAFQAEADLAGARAGYNRQLGTLNQAWAQLEATVGAPLDIFAVLDDLYATEEPLPEESLADDEAFENRSDLRSLANQMVVLGKQIEVNDTALNPTIASTLTWGYIGADSPLFQRWRAGLDLQLPLNQGNVTDSLNQEVLGSIEEVLERSFALRLEILGNLRSGYVGLAEAAQREVIASEQVDLARESYRLAERRYRSGISQYIELTNARTVLNRARGDLEQARFDRKLAEYRLMNEMEMVP